jgi:ATP-dependent Clp protease ATP-binding subunit ClpA
MAGGTSNMSSGAVDFALERAMEMARDSGREAPTLEQLLLALLDDESVQEMFANQYIDAELIRTLLQYHLETTSAEPQTPDIPRVAPALQNVMRRAVMKNMVSNKREVEATDIVVAILVEGASYAARVLNEQGLTVDEAENEALKSYLARQEQQSRRLEEMRTRIAEENTRQAQSAGALQTDSTSTIRMTSAQRTS